MAKYREKPVEVEAVRVKNAEYTRVSDPSTWDAPFVEMPAWLLILIEYGHMEAHADGCTDYLQWRIHTPSGTYNAGPGDYIVIDMNGDIYSCESDVFEQTYEPV